MGVKNLEVQSYITQFYHGNMTCLMWRTYPLRETSVFFRFSGLHKFASLNVNIWTFILSLQRWHDFGIITLEEKDKQKPNVIAKAVTGYWCCHADNFQAQLSNFFSTMNAKGKKRGVSSNFQSNPGMDLLKPPHSFRYHSFLEKEHKRWSKKVA